MNDFDSLLDRIFRLGGTVTIDGGISDRRIIGIDLSGNLSKNYYWQILNDCKGLLWIDFKDSSISDNDIIIMKEFGSLKELNLSRTCITDEGMKELRELRNLQYLDLSSTDVTDNGIRKIKHLKDLTILNLHRTKITGSGLKELVHFKELQVLILQNYTGDGYNHLWELGKLRTLFLGGSSIKDVELVGLRRLENLEVLDLEWCGVLYNGMKEIQELNNLRVLNLRMIQRYGGITEQGSKLIKNLSNLEELDLSYSTCTDETLKSLAELKNLKTLRIERAQISKRGLEYLQYIKSLKSLNLGETWRITDNDIKPLMKLGQLEELQMAGTKISEAGYQKLIEALPNTRILFGLLTDPKWSWF